MRYSGAPDPGKGGKGFAMGSEKRSNPPRSDRDMARMIGEVARSVRCDAVICGTETGALFRHLSEIGADLRLVRGDPQCGYTRRALA